MFKYNFIILNFISLYFLNFILVKTCPISCLQNAIYHIEQYNKIRIKHLVFLTSSLDGKEADEFYEEFLNSIFSPQSYWDIFIQKTSIQTNETSLSMAIPKVSAPTVV